MCEKFENVNRGCLTQDGVQRHYLTNTAVKLGFP